MDTDLIDMLPRRLEAILVTTLRPMEKVLIKLKGAFCEALVATDCRVMVMKTGFMTGQTFGSNVFQLPYSNLGGVEVKFNLMSGYFELSAGGMQNTPKNYWGNGQSKPQEAANCVSLNDRKQAERFRRACSRIIEYKEAPADRTQPASASAARTGVPRLDELFNKLEGLSGLRDKGVISPAEFETKKSELLAMI